MEALPLRKESQQNHSNDYPPFPQEVLTGAAGRFATTLGQYLESPASFLYACYLTCLGIIMSPWITLESGIKPQPRLFTVLVGTSAETRKSTAISKTVDLFQSTLRTNIPWVCWGVNSAEGLVRMLEGSPLLLLCIDELKILIGKMNLGASVLLPCVNSLFEKNEYGTATKKESILIHNAYLSLLTASTTDTFEKMFLPKFSDIGFVNRLFLVVDQGKKKFPIPPDVPEPVINELRGDLNNTMIFVAEQVEKSGGVYSMSIEPTAMEIYSDWYFTPHKSPFARRLDGYGHRLMSLLAINELKDQVDEEVMEKVIALLNYQLAVRQRLAPVEAFNAMAKLELLVRRKLGELGGSATKRMLQRKCNYNKYGIANYKSAIRHLQDNGEVVYRDGEYHLMADES